MINQQINQIKPMILAGIASVPSAINFNDSSIYNCISRSFKGENFSELSSQCRAVNVALCIVAVATAVTLAPVYATRFAAGARRFEAGVVAVGDRVVAGINTVLNRLHIL